MTRSLILKIIICFLLHGQKRNCSIEEPYPLQNQVEAPGVCRHGSPKRGRQSRSRAEPAPIESVLVQLPHNATSGEFFDIFDLRCL